jgi:hypothetical protein
MKIWAFLVALLYFLILVVVTWPVGYAAFYKSTYLHVKDLYGTWEYWSVLGAMVFSQLVLLTVPVRVASRKPLTRQHLLIPLIASGFMAGCLFLGVAYTLYEFIIRDIKQTQWLWWILASGGLLWVFWTFIFHGLSRNQNPQDMLTKVCRYLLAGSILELLIAIPAHILARHRDYCCAGAMTFLGLTTGISVMLFSFGPGVFFLFVDRWKKLHPRPDSEKDN